MVIEIGNKYSEKKKKELLEKAKKQAEKPKTLRDVFGILKDGIDGLKFQKTVRSEWD